MLWSGLDLDIQPGEFVAVLGPNGSGKTSLLRVLLGQVPLSAGRVEVNGTPVRRGSPLIGYVPQRTTIDSTAALRGRDLDRRGLEAPSPVALTLQALDPDPLRQHPVRQRAGHQIATVQWPTRSTLTSSVMKPLPPPPWA